MLYDEVYCAYIAGVDDHVKSASSHFSRKLRHRNAVVKAEVSVNGVHPAAVASGLIREGEGL